MADLKSNIYGTAQSLGMDPVTLATIMSYETGGTMNPMQAGPTTKWGQHRGYIQFGEPQAKQYGADFSSPEAAESSQFGENGAIARYFRENGWKPGMGIMDAYSIVNAGGPGRYGASDAAAGGAPGTVADKVMNQFSPHQAKALALLGIDPNMIGQGMFAGSPTMSSSGGTGGYSLSGSTGGFGDPTGYTPPAPLPNGPVPQYAPREGMIKQLLRGDIKGGLGSMFGADPNANPRLEAQRLTGLAEGMDEIGNSVRQGMANTNAPISWSQVLASALSEGGEGAYEGMASSASQSADSQLQAAMGQEMTPERIAQITALDPELGQKLTMDQRGFDQSQQQQHEAFLRQQELLGQKFSYDVSLQGGESLDPTALMQNAQAAGYTPGTPEYQQFIKDQLNKIEPTQVITGWTPEGLPIFGISTGQNGLATTPAPGSPSVMAPAGAGPTVEAAAAASGAPGDVTLPGVAGPTISGVPGAPTAPAVPAAPAAPPVGAAGTVLNVDPKEGTVTATNPDGTPVQTDIPGGKAAEEAAAAAEKAANRAKEVTEGNRIVVDAIDEALTRSGVSGAVGSGRIFSETIGGVLPGGGEGPLTGSPAASLDAIMKTVTSNLGFDALNKMRANSPNGSALGPVSDKENELLQSTKAALEASQTKDQFQEQLVKLRRQIVAITTGENYEEVMGFPPGGPNAPQAVTPDKYVPGTVYVDAEGNEARWNGTDFEDVK